MLIQTKKTMKYQYELTLEGLAIMKYTKYKRKNSPAIRGAMILENNDIVSYPALFHYRPIILGGKPAGVKEVFVRTWDAFRDFAGVFPKGSPGAFTELSIKARPFGALDRSRELGEFGQDHGRQPPDDFIAETETGHVPGASLSMQGKGGPAREIQEA